jgi:hypothetical protein
MATTTAALRRHDHRFVPADGKPDRRRLLFLSAVSGSFEDICYGQGTTRSATASNTTTRIRSLYSAAFLLFCGFAAASLSTQGEPSNRFALVSRRRLDPV